MILTLICGVVVGVHECFAVPEDGARGHQVSGGGAPVLLSPGLHYHPEVLDQCHQDPL